MRGGRDAQDGSATRSATIAVIALAVLIAVLVLVATVSGLGASPDSVAYLSLADEVRDRASPYAVLAPSPTHYAPLWSVLIGTISAVFGINDLLGIGRFVNAVAAATVPLLVYVAARRSTAVPAWWGVVAAALAGLTFGLFRLSVRALTEPLFVVLLLVTLLLVEAAAQRRSRHLLLGAATTAAAVVLTRFAGVALLLPVAAAVWRIAPRGSRRAVHLLTVAVIIVAPTALWAIAAPDTTTSTHLSAGQRGGVDQLVESFVEAGHVVLDPPSTGTAELLYLLLGAIVLAAPFIGAAVVAARRREIERRHDRSILGELEAVGLLPWLLFLAAYTTLIAAQRWWIGREIIDRYWVPYVVVGIVIVTRAVAESGLLNRRRWRTVAVATAGTLLLVNLGLVIAFAVTRADSGIELNEARYQDAELFRAAAEADVDMILTDSARLVELQLVAIGEADIVVSDVGCRWTGESNVVAMAEAAANSTAVILAGACDDEATRTALAAIAGSETLTEAGVGTLVLLAGR